MTPCRVCHKAPEGHDKPQVLSEVFQAFGQHLRWKVSDKTGTIYGVEVWFRDGSRVLISSVGPENNTGRMIALSPSQFTDDAHAIKPVVES